MGAPLGNAGYHRLGWLFTVHDLDPGLCVDTQYYRPVRRRHVEADIVLHLVVEQRALKSTSGAAKGRPDPADGGVRKSGLGGHGTDRPVGRVPERGVQCALDYL